MPAYSRPGLRWTRLQDQAALAYGQSVTFQTLGQVPPGRLIVGVKLVLNADFTQPAAASAIQFGEVFRQMLSSIVIGRRVSLTGLGATALEYMKRGRSLQFPGDIPATNNGVFSKRVEWHVSYMDFTSAKPFQLCPPSEFWTDQIECRLATNGIFAATAPTLGNATLRAYVAHVATPIRAQSGKITLPPSSQMIDQGFNALSAVIQKAGAWVYAVAYREAANDRGLFTSANVTALTTRVDGDAQLLNLRGEDAASVFNYTRANGSTRGQAAPATPLFNTPFESLDDQPAQATLAGQSASYELLPLVWPARGYGIAQLPRASSGLSVDLTGTLGAYRIAYQLLEPMNEGAVSAGARKLGVNGGAVASATASGNPLEDPELALYLPVDVE